VIADPIIQSLNDKHFTCLNHALLQELSTIGSAFYMRLFYHFATHYDGRHLDRVIFKKRYDDICTEWLGGITVLKHRSKIVGEQLGTHLDLLISLGFLKSYSITPAEGRDGFVLTFRPGVRFVADYNTFYARRFQGEFQFKFHDENRTIGEPHRVAYLFVEKLSGRKHDGGTYISSKDVETAKELLGHVSMEEMPNFIDYALREAGKTRFDLQTLGGVKQYLNGYLQKRHQHATAGATAIARQAEARQTQLRMDYDQYRRTAAEGLLETLPAVEQAAIEALARSNLRSDGRGPDYMAKTLFRLEKLRLTLERHPRQILDFKHWLVSLPA